MTAPHCEAATRSRLPEAICVVAEEIAGLLRSCTDATVPIPGAEWTVGESAAHLVLANKLMAALAAGHEQAYGDGTPGGLAAANAASLASFPERDTSVLAGGIVQHARAFTEAAGLRSADTPTVTPLGPMDLGTLGAYLLAHMLGHGYDIAAALGRPHMIDRDRVDLAMPFLITAMPRVVDAGAAAGRSACYELRVRGLSRLTVTFTNGAVAVHAEPPRRPDCTIMIDPITFFLIALGRRSATGAIARGKVLAWGRKPWLAPGFPALFTAP
ncbi:maleylpyruvate isomerase family mycothiol-dependent enzyme [Streptomyces sp. NPDC007251]|uniref:maleylpyruvate isomerase family mycothiol-dependent enzyme n=1 Tax=unclassified Streptomyces TaxID=2593676 RepID=UPI0033FBD052